MEEARTAAVGMVAADAEKRREAYKNLSNLLGDNGHTLDWNECHSAADTRKVLQNLKVDLTSHNMEAVQGAASVCFHLLANPSFLLHLNTTEQKGIMVILVRILKTSKNMDIINLILQSLARSRLKNEAYHSDLPETFDVVKDTLQQKDQSPSVVCGALQVVLALLDAQPDASVKLGTAWFPSTFSKMFLPNLKIRNLALEVTRKVRKTLDGMSSPGVRTELMATVLTDIKERYCNDMVRMVFNSKFSILQVWRETVAVLGTELHSRRYIINSLLNVVERTFKITDPDVRVESFKTWRTIIDNFALDRNTLTNQKKLQLLLAPFRVSNSRTEGVCSTKLHVWWHLVCLLAEKKSLAANFDHAVVPLLHFCFIGGLSAERDKAGRSNRNLVMSGVVSSPHRAFSSLHVTLAEVLAQVLAPDTNAAKYKNSIPALQEHVMSPAMFMRHFPLLLKCFFEAIQTLDFNDTQQNTLGKDIFGSLLAHIRAVTLPGVPKKEAVDVVKGLFNTLSHIENLCQPGDSQSQFLFMFFASLITGEMALPKKILNSHQYAIAVPGSGDAQDIMCGTLSNHLVTQLCRPSLLCHAITDKQYLDVWSTVIDNAQPVTGKLRFLQAVVQELSVCGVAVLCPDHPQVLCDLWNTVLQHMLMHITQVGRISDSSECEPDWGCVCSVLHFPLIHATDAFTCASPPLYQYIMEKWRKLWWKFTEITSSTPTVEPNSEAEHTASTLLAFCHDNAPDVSDVHLAFYTMTAEVLVPLTETFQYEKLGQLAEELSPSPAKAKRKPHPLHNLASTLELTVEVFDRTCSVVSRQRMHVAENLCRTALNMVTGIQTAPSKYTPEFIAVLVKLLIKGVRVNPAVVFDFSIEERFIGLFEQFTALVKSFITQKGSEEDMGDRLKVLTTLFSTAFTSTNNKVKAETHKLIETCVASMTAAFVYVPAFLLEAQSQWADAVPKPASVDDPESMEDFIQATPREKRGGRSLSGSKTSTPKNTTPVSTRKQKKELAEQIKQEKGVRGGGTSTPPTRLSARVRKGKKLLSDKDVAAGSDRSSNSPATPDVLARDAASGTASTSVVPKVTRTKSRASSPQSRNGKQVLPQSPSEPQGKEGTSKTTGEADTAAANPPDSDEPAIVTSVEPNPMANSDGKLTRTSNSATPAAKTASNGMRRSRSGKQNGLSTPAEKTEGDCLEGSEGLWEAGQSTVCPSSTNQTKINETTNKLDDELCAVLHDTSVEVQKLLEESCPDRPKPEEEEKSDQPLKQDQASTPRKKPETPSCRASPEKPQRYSGFKSTRINFMEVNVSPTVTKDIKLAQQRLKVKITSDKLEEKVQEPVVNLAQDDEEMVDLPDLNAKLPMDLTRDPDNSKSEKGHTVEALADKPTVEEQKDCVTPDTSSGRRRKRKLFAGQEEISVESVVKRRRTKTSPETHTNSLDDLITTLDKPYSKDMVSHDTREVPKPYRRTRSRPTPPDSDKETVNKTIDGHSKELIDKDCTEVKNAVTHPGPKTEEKCDVIELGSSVSEEIEINVSGELLKHSGKTDSGQGPRDAEVEERDAIVELGGSATEGTAANDKEEMAKPSKNIRSHPDHPESDGEEEGSQEIEILSSNSEEITGSRDGFKAFRKTKSHPGGLDAEKEVKKTVRPAFSPKITRSGRKITPPNKDMPEPMTPPKKSKKKLLHGADAGSDASPTSLSSSREENSCSLLGESMAEDEVVVDVSSPIKKTTPDTTPDASNTIEEEAKMADDNDDQSIRVVENPEISATSAETSSPSKPKGDIETPLPERRDSIEVVEGSPDAVKKVDVCSKDEEGDIRKTPSRKHRDSVEVVEESPDKPADKVDAHAEGKENAHTLEKTPTEEEKDISTESAKTKASEAAPVDKGQVPEDREQQPDTGKEMDLFEDSADPQKVSEESTPMECGQDLDGEVSYPAARRGTEILDDSASLETINRQEDVATSHSTSEEADVEMVDVDNDPRETVEKDDRIPESEDPVGREEEADKSLRVDEDYDDELNRTDTPASPDPEEEEMEEEEEEEFIDASQEKANEMKVGPEQEEDARTEPVNEDEPRQEQSCGKVEEPEDAVVSHEEEEEHSERTENTNDEKVKPETNSRQLTKLILPKRLGNPNLLGESNTKPTNTPSHENQDDKTTVRTYDSKAEIKEDFMSSISQAVMVSERLSDTPVAGELGGRQDDACVRGEAHRDQDTATAKGSVQDSKEEELPTEDSEKMDRDTTESGVCVDASRTDDKEEDDEVRNVTTPSKVLSSEDKNLEVETDGKESCKSSQKEIEVALVPEAAVNEDTKVVASPSKSVVTEAVPGDAKEPGEAKMTVLSPKRPCEPKTMIPVSEKDLKIKSSISSPSKNLRTAETVPSPRKTVEVKIPFPKKTVQVKEVMKEVTQTKPQPDLIKEGTPGPAKDIMATDTAKHTPGKPDRLSEAARDPEEDRSGPRSPQHPEKATPGDTATTSESSTETSSVRQQEEEQSPDKSSRSRLKLTVSTPERMKQRGAVMPTESRAAFLVACAKKNIKNRGGGEGGESPSSVLTESGRSRVLGHSPNRRSLPGRPSPGQSPEGRRKRLLDSLAMKPWVKHTPSPGASPSPSILKRTLLTDGLDGDTPSPPTKYRRVSFADPPVSERVEIPPSPRTLKGIRAQKRLDMTRMSSEGKDLEVEAAEKPGPQETGTETLDQDNPFYPGLVTCQDKVEKVSQHLTSPAMLMGLQTHLERMGINTVGQFCKLSEWDINALPVKSPKVTITRRVLREHEESWRRETSSPYQAPVDEVEANLAEIFGDLYDKENLRPNQQERAAPEQPPPKTEAEAREAAARASHSDNIQDIMAMEDITPLYTSPDETEEEAVKGWYRGASEDNVECQIKLLGHLLQTLPSSDVAEAIAQCIRTRMATPTKPT